MKPATLLGEGIRTAAVAASILLLGGCGFIFTKGPPSGHETMNYFSCSEGRVGPTLDLVWAGLNLVGAAAANSDVYSSSEYSPGQIRAIGLTEGVIWGASGLFGYKKVSRCLDAKQQLADRQGTGVRRRRSLQPAEEMPGTRFTSVGQPGVSPLQPIRVAGPVAASSISWIGLTPMIEDLTKGQVRQNKR